MGDSLNGSQFGQSKVALCTVRALAAFIRTVGPEPPGHAQSKEQPM